MVSTAFARSAMGADQAAAPRPPGERALPGEAGGPYPDPLELFNSAMFNFNIDVDQYVVTPAAKGYSYMMPEAGRQGVNNFFRNIGVIPRFANNLYHLQVYSAANELARFGINSTLGVAGFFDVADSWFEMKQHNDDFGLTLGHYGIYSGPYVMLPFLGPSTARDTVGLVVDGLMNPMSWLLPWYVTVPAGVGSQRGELSFASSKPVRGGRSLRGRPVRCGAGRVHANADCRAEASGAVMSGRGFKPASARRLMSAGSPLRLRGTGRNPGHVAVCADIDLDRFGAAKNEDAGVLQAPRDIRDGEMGGGGESLAARPHHRVEGDFMRGAMNRKDAAECCREFATLGTWAFGLLRRESDFRIALDFEDTVLHFAVAHVAVAVAADGGDNHASAGLTGCGIDSDDAAREPERTMSHVRPAL